MGSCLVRVTGDIHNSVHAYATSVLESKVAFSVQVGDMGYSYDDMNILDPQRHKFFGGNHDNYDLYDYSPHALGHFGVADYIKDFPFFFIRGAFSINGAQLLHKYYISGKKEIWLEEQLSLEEMYAALEQYCEVQPKIMMSHSAPKSIVDMISNPACLLRYGLDPATHCDGTQMLLEDCFQYHQPDLWIFGHFHQNLDINVGGTRFICLDEHTSMDIEIKDKTWKTL